MTFVCRHMSTHGGNNNAVIHETGNLGSRHLSEIWMDLEV